MKGRFALAAGALVITAAALLFQATPAHSYIPTLNANGATPAPSRWNFGGFPVQWNLNSAHNSNVSGTRTVEQAMQASFAPWTGLTVANVAVSEGASSSVSQETAPHPGVNLVCFVCSDADFTKDSTTLAVTLTTTADRVGESDEHGGTTLFVGQLIHADILFNPATTYSTDGSCGANCQDLQTVATHEIGHFLGLSHSAVIRSVMFPANSGETTLSYDDIAGIAYLYGSGGPASACANLGCISGTVRNSSAAGVFEAHVFAESTTGALFTNFGATARKSPIGTFTRPDGTYLITGLPPDSYTVTAEPLDGPMTATDLSTYAPAYGQPTGSTNFTTRSH